MAVNETQTLSRASTSPQRTQDGGYARIRELLHTAILSDGRSHHSTWTATRARSASRAHGQRAILPGAFPWVPRVRACSSSRGLAQTAGALCVSYVGEATNRSSSIHGIDRAKFRKPVLPGDQLHYHVKKIRSRGRAWRFYGEAKVNGQVVAEAEISAMILDAQMSHPKVHPTAIVEDARRSGCVRIGRYAIRPHVMLATMWRL